MRLVRSLVIVLEEELSVEVGLELDIYWGVFEGSHVAGLVGLRKVAGCIVIMGGCTDPCSQSP